MLLEPRAWRDDSTLASYFEIDLGKWIDKIGLITSAFPPAVSAISVDIRSPHT
jgi:hypothetical protein